MSNEQLTAPHLPAELSIKDTMAHLWAWQQLSIARLEAALHQTEPNFHLWSIEVDPDSEEGVERINAWTRQTYHGRPWSEVFQDWRDGFLHFLEVAEAIPEQDLVDAQKYPWLNGYALIDVLEGSFEHHHIDHLEPLLAWLHEHGSPRPTG
jgi:hypothetical protein